MYTGLNRESVLARIVAAFEGSEDDPLGAVLRELAALNEEAGMAAVADLLDAPDNQPSEKAQELPPPLPQDTPIEEREFGGWGGDTNVYYNPAACGLELLATAEEDEAYQFNYVCLWRDLGSGRFFMAQDSGCSCPIPFEDVTSVSDLTEVTTRKDAKQFLVAAGGDYTPSSMTDLLVKIGQVFPW